MSIKRHDWHSPTLKFLSFKEGIMSLRNASQKQSYLLWLQVLKNDLHVSCNCGGNNTSNLCVHAFKAIELMVWRLGKDYFRKLLPGGLIELALRTKDIWTKKNVSMV